MSENRLSYRQCSFVPPTGFSVLEQASSVVEGSCGCQCAAQGSDRGGRHHSHFTVTLIAQNDGLTPAEISESLDDLDQRAFPATITLMVQGHGGAPLAYLANTEKVLARSFAGFQIDFVKNSAVNGQTAARSQSSFMGIFRLFRLNYAWLTGNGLAVATMLVAEQGVAQGWQDLTAFVDSIQI